MLLLIVTLLGGEALMLMKDTFMIANQCGWEEA